MNVVSDGIYKSIVDTFDEALFLIDTDGIVLELNDLASSIVRLPLNSAIGSTLDSILAPEAAHFLIQQGHDTLVSGKERSIEKKALTLPGKGFRFYNIRINPIRRIKQNPYLAIFLRDITAQLRHETATEKARESAEAEADARAAFLARMSHELRTPMNGIMGMTDLALQSDPNSEVEEYLTVIKNASESLLIIINDVLDFAKIESGRMQLESLPIRLTSHLDETLALLRPAADEKGVGLTREIDKSLPDILVGDPTRLRQILVNLVGNAVKFTNNGDVIVRLEAGIVPAGHKADEIILVGTVKDSGIGIEQEVLQNIFDPFIQGSKTVNRKYGGTGLGLAICRNLTHLMGGDLEAESRPGEGSTFRFRIVLKTIPKTENQPTSKSGKTLAGFRWNGEKVLLVEDNRINRRVAEKILDRVGISVVSCNDGKEALKLWRTEKPVLILMDLQMPVMNGLEAAKHIRNEESAKNLPELPIIALTAHVLDEEKMISKDAGMSGWLGKPLRPSELYHELARFIPPTMNPNDETQSTRK